MKNVLLLCIFLIASCSMKSAQTNTPAGADPREQELRSIIADAEPLIHNMLNSLNTGGYAGYIKDFDDRARTLVTEEQFRGFQEKVKKKLGLYESGKYQVHKIEKHTNSYMIFYFVKFQNVDNQNPVIITMKVKKTDSRLRISDIAYRHMLLEA